MDKAEGPPVPERSCSTGCGKHCLEGRSRKGQAGLTSVKRAGQHSCTAATRAGGVRRLGPHLHCRQLDSSVALTLS